MNIEVTVHADTIDLNTRIDDERIDYDYENDREITQPRTLADLIAGKVMANVISDDEYKPLRKRFLDIRDEEIREAIRPVIARALVAPLKKTNSYGEEIGQETTLREIIFNEAKRALTIPKLDGYGRTTGDSIIQQFVREEIAKALKAELSPIIAEEKAKVVKAVRDRAAEMIAGAVRDGLRK